MCIAIAIILFASVVCVRAKDTMDFFVDAVVSKLYYCVHPFHCIGLENAPLGTGLRHFSLPRPKVTCRLSPRAGPLTLCRVNRFGDDSPATKGNEALRLARQGFELADKGRYSDAVAKLEASLVLVPNQGSLLFHLGVMQEELGESHDALEYYTRAIAVDPSEATAFIAKGDLLESLDKYSEALGVLNRAVQLEPARAEAWSTLGSLHHQNESLDDAQEAFRTAVMLLPGDPTLRGPFAAVLRDMGRFDESFSEYRQAVRLASDGQDGILVHSNSDETSITFAPFSLALRFGACDKEQLEAAEMASDNNVGIVSPLPSGGRVAALLNRSDFVGCTPPEWIERLRRVHVTRVATEAACEWAIAIAEKHADSTGGWYGRGEEYQYYHETNIIVVAENAQLRKWVRVLLRDGIWPAIKLQFDLDPDELWLKDCVVIKYEAHGRAGLGLHRDECELSFNMLLSDPTSFGGGGTAFIDAEPEGVTLQPSQGEVITHYGHAQHEGKEITGEAPRYILAGFMSVHPLAKRWKELLRSVT